MTTSVSSRRPPMTVSAHLRSSAIQRGLDTTSYGATVVEIGAGRGAWAARFAAAGYDYVGYEPDFDSFEATRHALMEVGRGTVVNDVLPAEPERVADVVVAFEVLEHIEDDAGALRAWFDWLRPGGLLIFSVPAHEARFASWDAAVGHYRRYEQEQLTALLDDAGFTGGKVRSFGFPVGYALEAVRNTLANGGGSIENRTAASGRRLQPAMWAGWLTAAAAAPFRWAQRPFERTDLGTGYVATAIRPDLE